MADCCLSLIEAGVFDKRQAERVRHLMKRAHELAGSELSVKLKARLSALQPSP
jgi:hypothetical protein